MTEIYNDLLLCGLTPEQRDRTCGYWYTITHNGFAYTAFRTAAALYKWLDDHGRKLERVLPALGTHTVQKIAGVHREKLHTSYDEFYSLDAALDIFALSNGEYTMARITRDGDGIRTIHKLNPNCKYRQTYKYFDCRENENLGCNDVGRLP